MGLVGDRVEGMKMETECKVYLAEILIKVL